MGASSTMVALRLCSEPGCCPRERHCGHARTEDCTVRMLLGPSLQQGHHAQAMMAGDILPSVLAYRIGDLSCLL